MRRRRF